MNLSAKPCYPIITELQPWQNNRGETMYEVYSTESITFKERLIIAGFNNSGLFNKDIPLLDSIEMLMCGINAIIKEMEGE